MRRGRVPPLGTLRAFEAAARLVSFKAAADELGVTQSAVSHRIGDLEAYLGVRLFERHARGVALSEAGLIYYPSLRDAFDRIVQGTAVVMRQASTDDLVIATYVTVAVQWLMPRLASFRAENPGLMIRLSTSQLDWELNLDSADVGIIQTAHPTRPDLHYTHLHRARLIAVCSPSLADDMSTGPGLHSATRFEVYPASSDWERWLAGQGQPIEANGALLQFDSYLLAIEAAIAGWGIALVPEFLADRELKSGRLAIPFDRTIDQTEEWYLIYRRTRRKDTRITAFAKWLTERFSELSA